MSLTKATYAMITGAAVNVFDYMTAAQIADVQAGTLSLDVTDAINAAIDFVKPTGGQIVFPVGKYSVAGNGINLLGVSNVSIIGLSNGLDANKFPELVARTAGSYLFMLSASATLSTISIYIENITFNGNNLIDNVFTVNPYAGQEVSYNTLVRCNFLNTKANGTLFSNQTAGATFAESAIWYFQECGFACNGYPGNLGNAVQINNYGAWGYVFDRCHFDTTTQYAHIRLIAGEVTLNNCIFDNSNDAGGLIPTNIGDIQMYSSAGLTVNNCITGSAHPFLTTYAKSTTGKWDDYPIRVNGLESNNTYPPTNGIVHSTTNPIYVSNYVGSNVEILGSPIDVFIVGNSFNYQGGRFSTIFAAQKTGAAYDALTLASPDLTTFLETNVSSTGGVGVSSYKPGTGYQDYQVVAKDITWNLSNGKLNIANLTQTYANNAAAIAGGLVVGDVYRNGDVLQIVH